MADIKQAAKWFQEGRICRRNSADADICLRYKYDGDWFIAYEGESEFELGMLTVSDLLAEDWELAEPEPEQGG